MTRDNVLVQRPGPAASLVIRNARLLDPDAGIDTVADLVIRDGRIGGVADGLPEIDGTGLLVVPGFVDPHVHLRTPGREDTEDIALGLARGRRRRVRRDRRHAEHRPARR